MGATEGSLARMETAAPGVGKTAVRATGTGEEGRGRHTVG